MFLSADDVSEILALIDDSEVDELRLHTNDFDLLLRRKADGSWVQQKQELAEAALTELTESTVENKNSLGDEAAAQHPDTEHLVAIPTPLPGTFYRAPKPGAAPFVEIGDQVEENTVVAIIETMKLMNSVTANTSGTIVKICKEDAEFADQDSVIMFVEPN